MIPDGWKTYVTAFIPIIFGVLQMTDWSSFIANPKAGITALASGLLMAIMRKITDMTTIKAIRNG